MSRVTVEVSSSITLMPFGSYESEKPVSVPTFLQYCKTCSKQVEKKTKFSVDVIWLPGKFNNVTLQTHAFRFIAGESHPLYSEVIEYCSTIKPDSTSQRVEIVIDSIDDKTITVSESKTKPGQWKKLGSNAFKFETD